MEATTDMAIKIKSKECCTGCEACAQICPVDAINFESDNEGFLYPIVDHRKCTECGACERVCPVVNKNETREPIRIYAAKNRNEQIREASSSGGIFTLLAEAIIRDGGVVFGAKFNEQWEVVHDYTETIDGIAAFRGSKYVQSRIADNFKRAKEFLDAGRRVLFSGTPCQIAGLKLFLGRNYDNLLAMDFVCHSVPSPAVWRAYLKECVTDIRNIQIINFRDKSKGWRIWNLRINDKYKNRRKDPYTKGYLSNLYLRPSCLACPAKPQRSGSDITLADFWGVEKFLPESDDNRGMSLIAINSDRGDKIYKNIGADSIEMTSSAYDKNTCYYNSVTAHENRTQFFEKFNSGNYQLIPLIVSFMTPEPPLWAKIVWNSKRVIRGVFK